MPHIHTNPYYGDPNLDPNAANTGSNGGGAGGNAGSNSGGPWGWGGGGSGVSSGLKTPVITMKDPLNGMVVFEMYTDGSILQGPMWTTTDLVANQFLMALETQFGLITAAIQHNQAHGITIAPAATTPVRGAPVPPAGAGTAGIDPDPLKPILDPVYAPIP